MADRRRVDEAVSGRNGIWEVKSRSVSMVKDLICKANKENLLFYNVIKNRGYLFSTFLNFCFIPYSGFFILFNKCFN